MRSAVITPKRYTLWHRWFAWRPILVASGHCFVWVWWEYVERKMIPHYDGHDWEYRLWQP